MNTQCLKDCCQMVISGWLHGTNAQVHIDLGWHSVNTNGATDVLWFNGGYYSWADMVNDWKAGKVDQAVVDRVYQETLKAYQQQLSAYYSTSELWDDGMIDPVDTRNALGVALSAAQNAPFGEPGYGVFRF